MTDRSVLTQQTLESEERSTALSLIAVTKQFPGGRGLDSVDLHVAPGSVHALLGQNGSGKSTLIKVLAGVYQADRIGLATCHGTELDLGLPTAARDAGIRFIHQDLGLIPDLDVTANLGLGRNFTAKWWLSDHVEHRRSQALLESLGIKIDPRSRLGDLSPARQSMVAIARAMSDDHEGPRLMVLDEPTAALPKAEVDHLFELIERLRDEGATVIYVTHRLEEVFRIADDVTVLRDGKNVVTRSVDGLDHDSLVELIIGRPPEAFYAHADARPSGKVRFMARGFRGATVKSFDVSVHAGEVLGIAGLVGSGHEEVLQLMAGGVPCDAGSVEVDGAQVPLSGPSAAIRAGIAFAPADRKRFSAIPAWSLRENITLPALMPSAGFWLGERSESEQVRPWLKRMQVVHEPESLFSTLSGGNQQRVVLARWMRAGAKVLLLQEPTNGVDTGAKHAIYEALSDAASGGAAIVMSSSDYEELASVCDRVIVLVEGQIFTELTGHRLTVDNIMTACLSRLRQNPEGAIA